MDTQSRFDGVADRGSVIFENQIKEQVTGLDPAAFLAIDVDSGDFEVAEDDITVFDNLRTRRPNAVIFLRRVGDPVAYFMGGVGL